MTPAQLLTTVSSVMLRQPPTGLTRQEVRRFLARNESKLLATIQRQFEKMCRPGALVAGYEQKIGYHFSPGEPDPQIGVFGQDVGSSSITLLAIKARCNPMDPVRSRQYAAHSRRVDEKTWRIHSAEDWHPDEDAAIAAFATAHAHEARWLVDGKDENWTGIKDAPYVLSEPRAVESAREKLAALEEKRARDERAIQAFHQRSASAIGKQEHLEEPDEDSNAEKALTERQFTLDGDPVGIHEFITVNRLGRSEVRDILSLQPGELLNYGGGAAAHFVLKRVDGEADTSHLDPVIQAIVNHGGLRTSLLTDITPELRPKARAIQGFLRTNGLSWLEAARAHYGPDVPVIEGSPSLDDWSESGAEGTDGYIELVHFGLEYSFPGVGDEHYEEGEMVERLCGCQGRTRRNFESQIM